MTPRFFTCSVPQCSKPSVRAAGGSCDSCNRYLCYTHMSPSFHKCEEIVDDAAYGAQISAEIENLRSRINEEAVRKLASGLNDGKSCSIEHSPVTGPGILMGCANYHARIRFHDGSPSWLIRIPRVTSCAVGFPVPLANYLIRSEYATLKFLETTAVPAPRAFGYGISGSEIEKDHGVGISFLLIEELPGRPWIGNGVSGNEATREEKEKIWGAAADILAELEKHPFPRAGSLCCEYFVDENLNVTGIIDWQMARVVPRHEAFGASLVTADMNALCSGKISLSDADTALAKALRDRGSPELASCMADEKVRRFFWGLASEPKWSYALPLAEALLKIFGVSQDWTIWRETALKDYGDDERLQALVDQF